MKEALDLASKSGIHRLITALEERGFIRRLPNRARALEVLRLPDSIAPGLSPQKKFAPSVIEGSLGKVASVQPVRPAPAPQNSEAPATVSVPVMGRIAAGVPISAIQNQTHMLSLPPEMIGAGEHYALEVKGDSMIDAGIFDGDTVIIKRGDTANPGEIVVALVDEEEATLKRFRREALPSHWKQPIRPMKPGFSALIGCMFREACGLDPPLLSGTVSAPALCFTRC